MSARCAVSAVALTAIVASGCTGDDETRPAAARGLKPATALEADPYAITCGHVQDQQTWASATRRATVAIGNREKIRGLNRLQATQSLFFAMTELCKGRPASYEPAEAAVNGVRTGRYRVDLNAP